MIPILELIIAWLQNNSIRGLGIILIIGGLVLTFSELRVYFKHDATSEQLVFWSMVLTAGIFTTAFNDFILGILLGISILMFVETARMWDTPVWGKLMAATTASYVVILLGYVGQMIFDAVTQPETPNDQIFSGAFNIAFYVFIGVAFIFFGKKFILVSRFSSPQMVYLFLFGVLYVFIAKFFPRDGNDLIINFNYLGIQGNWRKNVLFADFGTFEALIIVMILLYFISGWLLQVLMGVQPIEDPIIMEKVQKVAKIMGITGKVKVGFVKAPILNAFAYGPWFDKRIAFISNDVNEFTDSDINGIVGHELAHSANHHILFLLLLNVAELAFKKGVGLPASTLDYTLLPDSAVLKVGFVGYYAISYGLLIFLLLFVRLLEGHADKKTKEAGFAKDLSQALFRLEGFYNGVASDFGISVNLLTDRVYSPAERRRFVAQAGRNLYNEVVSPTRMAALANIFQSHPRTSYRIASLVDEKLNPIKAAFLPYQLLGFGLRKRAVKQLNLIHESYHTLVDATYYEDHGEDALNEVMQYNPWLEPYLDFADKDVIAYNKFEKEAIIGKFSNISETNRVTSPVSATVGDQKIELSLSIIKEFYPGQEYVLKTGEIVTLKDSIIDEKKGCLIQVHQNGKIKEIPISLLGKPLNYFKNLQDKEVLLYEKGTSKIAKLENILFESDFHSSVLIVSGREFMGSEFIVGFSPLGFEIRKTKLEDQIPLLQYLVGKKILLYTKENFDVSLAGTLKELNNDHLILTDADGDHEIKMEDLEYAMFATPTVEFISREQVSLFTKFGVWWSNRKEFNYIF